MNKNTKDLREDILDVMLLLKLHNQQIKELEKRLDKYLEELPQ